MRRPRLEAFVADRASLAPIAGEGDPAPLRRLAAARAAEKQMPMRMFLE